MGMIHMLIIFVSTLPRMLNSREGMGLIVGGLYAPLNHQLVAQAVQVGHARLPLQGVQMEHLRRIHVLNIRSLSRVMRVIVQMGITRWVFVASGLIGLLIV